MDGSTPKFRMIKKWIRAPSKLSDVSWLTVMCSWSFANDDIRVCFRFLLWLSIHLANDWSSSICNYFQTSNDLNRESRISGPPLAINHYYVTMCTRGLYVQLFPEHNMNNIRIIQQIALWHTGSVQPLFGPEWHCRDPGEGDGRHTYRPNC